MNKVGIFIVGILVVVLVAVTVRNSLEMKLHKAEMAHRLETAIEKVQTDNEALTQNYDTALREALQKQEHEWELKHADVLAKVREALLNAGVSLEQLDAELMANKEPEVDLSITQAVYESLKKGQTYEEVAEVLGREGENYLNIEDTAGLTSSYEWRWDDVNDEPQTLGITFINNKLNHKTYSAFVF